jgi:hypothetical protein
VPSRGSAWTRSRGVPARCSKRTRPWASVNAPATDAPPYEPRSATAIPSRGDPATSVTVTSSRGSAEGTAGGAGCSSTGSAREGVVRSAVRRPASRRSSPPSRSHQATPSATTTTATSARQYGQS